MKKITKYIKESKNYIYTYITACITIVAILFVYNIKIQEDFKTNLITELIGVFFTIVVIDRINEDRQRKNHEIKEQQKIKRATDILMPLFDLYYKYLIRMTQPIGQCDGTKILNFKFTDFQHFYNISLYQINSTYEKAFILHFKTLLKLRDEVSKLMINLDDHTNPEYLNLMKKFIINNTEIDILFENFKDNLRMRVGGQPTIDSDTDFFKRMESGEIDQDLEFIETHSHALFAYARFYRITKENVNLIEQLCLYTSCIS